MASVSGILRESRFTPENIPKFEAKLFFEGSRQRKYLEQLSVMLLLSTTIATMVIMSDAVAAGNLQ